MASLMIQGTSSHVGKSVFTAGLGYFLRHSGYRVCPFKPQNISSVSYCMPDGTEIGYTQQVQSLACGADAHVCMNPVLIKIGKDHTQFIINGRTVYRGDFREYSKLVPVMKKAIAEAFVFLKNQYDIVLIEGAGSPVEINRECADLSNMEAAVLTKSPVVLLADMERGGAFASVAGTMELLSPFYRKYVKGFVFNKYSGDPGLLQKGTNVLKRRYAMNFYGILPFLEGLTLPAEDTGTYLRENTEFQKREREWCRSFDCVSRAIEHYLDTKALLRLL